MLNKTFDELRLEKHPDKTIIGRIEKGFDFLGYHFSPEGLSVAEKTIEKFLARAVRLYEQEQREPFGSPLLGLYVERLKRFIATITHCAAYHSRALLVRCAEEFEGYLLWGEEGYAVATGCDEAVACGVWYRARDGA